MAETEPVATPVPPASGEGKTDDAYGEAQWQGTIAASESFVGGAEEFEVPAGTEPADENPHGPLPEVEELLKKVPARSRELIDILFRGRFVSVQVIDRSKLY